ncbi:MAG TPA: EAL domain-containing protein [Gemmatimonadaceae bacterium]|nr:EAL domain-containing protein [Gemmatimonadaceae bacterium]
MDKTPSGSLADFSAATAAVLESQYAAAERNVNGVRIAVIGILAIAAALWMPYLTAPLNWVNVAVCTPMLLWAIGQHFAFHRPGRTRRHLSSLNTVLDISAVSLLLLGYGLFGFPDLAVKSPMWTAYLIVLAARPFTGSPRSAAAATGVAALQYAILALFFTYSGRLVLLESPLDSVRTTGTTIPDEGAKILLIMVGGLILTYATVWNARTLRRSVDSMRESESRFRAVFEHSAVGIALLDESARILQTNDAFDRFLEYRSRDLIGHDLSELAVTEHAETATLMVRDVAEGHRESATAELRFARRTGQLAWGAVTVSHARENNEVRLIAMVQDTSERKTLEAQLLHQAFHDPLTELANRALFSDRLEHALARTAREPGRVAVLLLDLDNFKTVNDTQGHAAGDRMLEVVAARLRSATRGCDTVARLGGDEFAVLLEQMHASAGAQIVAQRILETLQHPVEISLGRVASVAASVGIAILHGGEGAEELLRNADVAMYEAKSRARGRWVIFDPDMHAALVDRVSMEMDLRRAIDRQQLVLAYQPIVDLGTGKPTGVEALLRWSHPQRGDIPPGAFIPLAEETGLIIPLGRWVLHEACRQGARWNARPGRSPITVTINLSGKQLLHEAIVDDVEAALQRTGLEPGHLVLEITETVLMHDTEIVLERLRAFKTLGVRLAIDDFGTGYSSLSYLQQFPVDVLKIDQSFIEGLLRGTNDAALVRTIISLAGSLTLRTIAEGVEDPRQQAQLRELGCDAAQGFLFSRAIAPADMDELLEANTGPRRPTPRHEPAVA